MSGDVWRGEDMRRTRTEALEDELQRERGEKAELEKQLSRKQFFGAEMECSSSHRSIEADEKLDGSI